MFYERITLQEVLDTLNEKQYPNSKRIPYDITFVAKSGELIRLKKATRVGTKEHFNDEWIGLKTIDNDHHPYTVHIRTIVQFERKRVIW